MMNNDVTNVIIYNWMQLSSEDRQVLQNLKFKLLFLPWRKYMQKSKKRYLRFNELVQTEATYYKDLILIREKIQKPLLEMKIMTQREQKQLFPNIEGMINLSKQLLTDITKLRDQWNPIKTMVGPTMIRYSQFLQIYAEYFRTQQRTSQWLQDLLHRKDVREIQVQLSPFSFVDVWIKPLQRTLKYVLLLQEYLSECYPSHPDYPQLTRAIKKYREAGERNNRTMQIKERNEKLLSLDARYPGILNQDSKMYIGQVQATFIDQKMKCHLLTNMLLVVTDDTPQTQLMRLYLDQTSFVASLKDLLYFKNRLYICGKKHSVHLCFASNKLRNECEREVQGIINEIYKSQYMRKELTSNLQVNRSSQQDMRESDMQLPEILPKPPRLIILGQIRRRYGCIKSFKIYFVVKFMLPYGQENSQELYLDVEQLLALETSMRTLYPQELKQLPILQQVSKNMNATDIRVNSVRAIEYKSIYATIMLNFLFRHPQLTKRTDIMAHRLHVGQPMWLYLRYGWKRCGCYHCNNGAVLSSIDNYQREAAQRTARRKEVNTFFCPFRTFHAQNMLAQADLSLIPTANDRLLFLRCEKGLIDYRLADNTPGSPIRKKVLVHIQRIEGSRALQLLVNPQQRVGQIVEICAKLLGLRMYDHQLFLFVNKNTYLLGRDEILWKILENQTTAGDNFFSFFKSAFGEKEDTSFKLRLRKVWVLECALEKANYQHEGQVTFLIEQFVLRLRRQQVKLNMDNTSTLYACYYSLQKLNKQSPVTEQDLKVLIAPKRWKAMQVQQRIQLLGIVRLKVDAVMGKLTPAQIYRKVWNYAVSMGQKCPGWSAFFFSAAVQAHPQYEQGFQVRIGADLQKLYVMQADSMTTVLQFPLSQVQSMLVFSSWEMHICTSQFEYTFTGDSLLHLEQLISTYLLYQQLQQ